MSSSCNHRDQHRSSNSSEPAAAADYVDVNVIPHPTRQQHLQPPYQDIELDSTQHDPDAGHYESLKRETLGEQHLYVAIPRPQTHKDAADYVNINELPIENRMV